MACGLSARHGAFPKHIDRIHDLRISKPIPRNASALYPQMYPAGARAFDEATAAFGESRSEVPIVLPTVKHQPFVKSQFADGGAPESHVAAIGAVSFDARPLKRLIVGCENVERLVKAQARSVDAISNNMSGNSHYVRFVSEGPSGGR